LNGDDGVRKKKKKSLSDPIWAKCVQETPYLISLNPVVNMFGVKEKSLVTFG